MFEYNKTQNTHIITFDYDETIITYDKYVEMIETCKKWYNTKFKKVINEYELLIKNNSFEKSLEISNIHNNIVIELINKVLSYYPIVNEIKFGLFISNSFARGTNLIDSDFDLNFVYEIENHNIGLQIEEQISYALTQIVSKYRDFVHDSITHRMRLMPNNIEYLDGDKVLFVNKWNDKTISYDITSGNEKMMIDYCFGRRDIKAYIKYMSSYIEEDKINEWLYYQKIIIGNDYISIIFDKLIKKEKAIIKLPNYRKTFNKMINEISLEFRNQLNEFNENDFTDMKQFKKHFKNMTYNKIFTVFALLKKIKLFSDGAFEYNDIYNFSNNNLTNKNYQKVILDYFGNIMHFNYVCDMYGIEFRTRYSNNISTEFQEYYKEICDDSTDMFDKFRCLSKQIYIESIKIIESLKQTEDNKDRVIFDPNNEYINISNYSPFSHINEVSNEYQKKAFMLPFIKLQNEIVPIHPDTFDDLNLDVHNIIDEILVYPTSSYRTVYDPINNKCYKLVLLRKITRSIRNLPNKELNRSSIAAKLLSKYKFPNFTFLNETCIFNENENFNYITREMPKVKTYPWFYVIASQKFSKDFQLKCITNIIKSWMFFASKEIYFESPHTQNYLVDLNANIYYRDLSDIRNLNYEIMTPSFYNNLSCDGEMLSVFFDRAICNQNLEHLFRYCTDMNEDDFNYIRDLILSEIEKYNLKFPNYSMNYSKSKSGHIPEKVDKVRWR